MLVFPMGDSCDLPDWVKKACTPDLLDPAILPLSEWVQGLIAEGSREELDVQAGYELARYANGLGPLYRRVRALEAEQWKHIRARGRSYAQGCPRRPPIRFADTYLDSTARNRSCDARSRPWIELALEDRQLIFEKQRWLFASPSMRPQGAVQLLASDGDRTHGTGQVGVGLMRGGFVPKDAGLRLEMTVDLTKSITQLRREFGDRMAFLREVRGIRETSKRGRFEQPDALLNALGWLRIRRSNVLGSMSSFDFCRIIQEVDRRFGTAFTEWRVRDARRVVEREWNARFHGRIVASPTEGGLVTID